LTMSDTPGCTILPCVRYEKGLFVGTGSGAGTLLYVDLFGNAKTLWEHLSSLLSSPSPDGRHLAIADHTMDRNFA
jgi:hypothetical protein